MLGLEILELSTLKPKPIVHQELNSAVGVYG
jgi:hypothetical protein